MKQGSKVLTSIMLFALTFAVSAQADRRGSNTGPRHIVVGATFTKLAADPSLGELVDGRVDIDTTGRVARLILQQKRGNPVTVLFGNVRASRSTCGAITYTAVRPATAQNPEALTLVVRDNSDNRCGTESVGNPTDLELQRTVGGKSSKSKFQAERLSRQDLNYIETDGGGES